MIIDWFVYCKFYIRLLGKLWEISEIFNFLIFKLLVIALLKTLLNDQDILGNYEQISISSWSQSETKPAVNSNYADSRVKIISCCKSITTSLQFITIFFGVDIFLSDFHKKCRLIANLFRSDMSKVAYRRITLLIFYNFSWQL